MHKAPCTAVHPPLSTRSLQVFAKILKPPLHVLSKTMWSNGMSAAARKVRDVCNVTDDLRKKDIVPSLRLESQANIHGRHILLSGAQRRLISSLSDGLSSLFDHFFCSHKKHWLLWHVSKPLSFTTTMSNPPPPDHKRTSKKNRVPGYLMPVATQFDQTRADMSKCADPK